MKKTETTLGLVSTQISQESLCLEYEFFQNFQSPHTRKSYQNDLNAFFTFIGQNFRNLSILCIARIHVIAFRNWLAENSYAPKSISRKLSSLSTYFKFLIEKNHLAINPCDGVGRPKQIVKSETNDLSDEEVVSLLEVVDHQASHLHRAIIYLFFFSGIRKSELINLKLKDYKEINAQMTITILAKGGKTLIKFLPSICAEVIADYLENMRANGREVDPEDWIFQPSKNPSSVGANLTRPLRPKSVDYIFSKYCRLAGIFKRVSPHSARATYIGSALQNGANLVKVSRDVGHCSVQTTEQYNKRRNRAEDSPVHSLGFLKAN